MPTDNAVSSVYRAIWNSDYDTDLTPNGRTAAHQLAEEIAGTLTKDGLLAGQPANLETVRDQIAHAIDDNEPSGPRTQLNAIMTIVDPIVERRDYYRDAAVAEKDRADAEARAAAGLREDVRQAHAEQEFSSRLEKLRAWRPATVEAAPPKTGIALADELWPPVEATSASLAERLTSAAQGETKRLAGCHCPGSGTHAHVRGCRLHPEASDG